MILGHITNTYMLYSLSGKKVRRMVFLPLLFFGALLPDIGDKGLHYIVTASYPGRGLLHSVVILSALLLILVISLKKYKTVWLTIYLGALLHIAQDWSSATTALWPFYGPWEIGDSETILEKFWRTYIDMSPLGLWVVEMVSLAYCVVLLFARFKRTRGRTTPEVKEGTSQPEGQ